MHNDFALKLTEMMRLCGKSSYEVARDGMLDPSYVRCLAAGTKKNPGPETIYKLFVGCIFDVRLWEKDQADDIQQGLKALAQAAGLGVAVINVLED